MLQVIDDKNASYEKQTGFPSDKRQCQKEVLTGTDTIATDVAQFMVR